MNLLISAALIGVILVTHAWAQADWRPEKQVEIILPTAPGGGNDMVARLIGKALQEQKFLATPILVVNKPGGNQALSPAYPIPANEIPSL